jgi:peroxiredoxin
MDRLRKLLLFVTLFSLITNVILRAENDKGDVKVEDTTKETAASDWEDSRAWYLLRQTDTTGLLHGLPQRLGKVIVPSKRQAPMWQGVENGGTIDLEIRVEGEAPGEIFVGFFTDARWWLSPPVQVRRFPGPGRYTVDRLMPGKYCLGAMIGSLPRPDAFGVHRRWPAPIEIERATTLRVDVLVSVDFKDMVCHPDQYKGFAGQFGLVDPAQMITVRTVDHQGNPAPFCRVTYRDRDPSSYDPFHGIGTDDQGYSYCGKMDGPFSLTVARYDFLPENFAQRYQFRRFHEVHNTANRKVVTVQWPPYPTGTGKVKGRIYNQHGQALRTYFLSISQDEKGSNLSETDHHSFGYEVPITDTDGRFEIENLPPGRYKVMVRAFDYATHAWDFNMGQFTIADKDNAVTEFNLEVEVKELLYGRALYEDGSPVYPGSHIARFGRDDYFAESMEKDGAFRICLSKQEREDLLKNRGGMIDIRGKTDEEWHKLREVHIDKLSKDRNSAAEIRVPRPKIEPPSAGARDKTQRPTRPTIINDGRNPWPPMDQPTIEPLELTDTDGHTRRLSDYEGKAVLLNIFATWCGPCKMERPHLIELHSQYADKGLVILAISRGEKPDVVESWVRKNRLPFPVLVDEEQKATRQFANEKKRVPVPTNILLDQQHRIIKQSSGFSERKFVELEAAVANLIMQR